MHMNKIVVPHEARKGDWLQTFTGKAFWPLDPRPEDVDIRDIAHGLSMMCRYNGHCTKFYSVAEHSIILSHCVQPRFAFWALLHDAAEAYCSDIPKPLKRFLPDFMAIEAKIMRAVCQHFGLPEQEPAEVKDRDYAILADEKAQVMTPEAPGTPGWGELPPPLGVKIEGLYPDEAEARFLKRYGEICRDY